MSKIMEEDVGKFPDIRVFSDEIGNLQNFVQGEDIYKAYPEYGTIFVFRMVEITIPTGPNMSPGRTRVRLSVDKALSIIPASAETEEIWEIVREQHIESIPLHHFTQDYSFKLEDAKSNLVEGLAHMLERAKEIDPDHFKPEGFESEEECKDDDWDEDD